MYYDGWSLNPEAEKAVWAEYTIGLAFANNKER
jgi:hypothetical protein